MATERKENLSYQYRQLCLSCMKENQSHTKVYLNTFWVRVRVRNYGRWSDLGGKNICLLRWFNINLWSIFTFAGFLTWSLNCNFYSNFYNTMCWYSGKDSGLSPRRPQFKSHSQQAFLQKDFPWKFFKKWLSPVWKLFEGYFEIHYS